MRKNLIEEFMEIEIGEILILLYIQMHLSGNYVENQIPKILVASY